jgi:CubicO group peptidase (beta-lactamase class C family)
MTTMLTSVEHDLKRTSPERQGVASSALLAFVQAAENQIHDLHSFMLLRHGSVIAEGWWSPYKPEYPHMMFSVSKSFTSTAVGLAVSEGRFSLDDPVVSFFPKEAPDDMRDHLAAMRVRHLLTMSTGHESETIPPMMRRPDLNWVKGFLDAPVVYEPGTHFLYNTGATYMLSAILQKTTGMNLMDYLQPRLFEPLGIKGAAWLKSPQGIVVGGFGLTIKTEDLARFGQLYLQKGMWNGNRLLDEAWIIQATSAQISNGDPALDNDWTQGYGYQFWRCRHDAYRGDGAFGQYCIVMPEQDAVLAITGGLGDMQPPLNLVWDILLPAMGSESLPEGSNAHNALVEKLSTLGIPPLQRQITASTAAAIQSTISGRTYVVEENEMKIETLMLDFTETGSTVTITTSTRKEIFACGDGTWQSGKTRLFNEPWLTEPTPVVTSGVWTANDRFTMIVRLYETAFYYTFVFQFTGDELKVETRVNVSFEEINTVVLTAHAAYSDAAG